MDETKPLSVVTGGARRGLSPGLQPRGIRWEVENHQTGPQGGGLCLGGRFGAQLCQARHLPGWSDPGAAQLDIPRAAAQLSANTSGASVLHPRELAAQMPWGWVTGPLSPHEATARLVSSGGLQPSLCAPTLLLAAKPAVGKTPPK